MKAASGRDFENSAEGLTIATGCSPANGLFHEAAESFAQSAGREVANRMMASSDTPGEALAHAGALGIDDVEVVDR